MTAFIQLEMIKTLHPEILNEVSTLAKPTRSDLSKVIVSYSLFQLVNHIYPNDEVMNKAAFVGSMTLLYCPAALYIDGSHANKNLNDQIAICFGCTSRMVRYYASQARHYYKNVPSFKQKVHQLSEEL